MPAALALSDARYLLRDEDGDPELVVVVRENRVTVIDAVPGAEPPPPLVAVEALQRAIETYGELSGEPELGEFEPTGWRSGRGEGPKLADGELE